MPAPDADRPVDILDRDIAAILEADVDAIADALVDDRGDADAAWFGERFKPRGDVDAVAVEVVALHDHVAEIDADAQHDRRLGGALIRCVLRRALHRQGAVHGIDDACEFDDGAIADQLHDPAFVGGDRRVEDGFPMPLQGGERARFVGRHHP